MEHQSLRDHRQLSDRFVGVVARAIVGGEYTDGDPLPSESAFSERHSLSKPTIRQGLAKLADVGLIRIQHGRRSVVLDESNWNVLSGVVSEAYTDVGRGAELAAHLWEVRRLLESAAASYAATRASEREIAELTALGGRLTSIAYGSREITAFLEIDRRFHEVIASASGNPALRSIIRPTHRFLTGLWDRDSRTLPSHLPALAEQHERISSAVRAHDPERARTAMMDHIDAAEKIESACPQWLSLSGDDPG